VQYRNATTVSARDSGGTLRNHLTFGGETLWWAGVGGGFRWVNAGNSVQWMALDASGNLAVTGTLSSASHTVTGFVTATTYISAGPAISGSPGDLNANRNNGSGYVFLANASHYVGFDGTYYQMPTSTLVVGGGVYVGGGINTGITTSQLIITGSTGTWILDHGSGIVSYVSGNYVNASSRAIIEQPGSPWGGYGQFWSGPILINGGGGSATISLNNINGGSAYLSAVGCYAVVGGSNNNSQSFYCAGGSGGPTGWQIISTERYKSSLVVIDNALKIVLDPTLHGMHYTKTISAKLTGGEDAVDSEPFEEYGFIAEPWSQVAPDVVGYHEGVVHMMDYGQVNAILFEAFKQYVAQTDARLDRLEANA
jgi:hypothetical protein